MFNFYLSTEFFSDVYDGGCFHTHLSHAQISVSRFVERSRRVANSSRTTENPHIANCGLQKADVPEEISALSSMTTTREGGGGHSKRGQDARLRASLSREHNFNERREEVLQVKKIVLHLVKHTKSICTQDVIGIPVIVVTSNTLDDSSVTNVVLSTQRTPVALPLRG